MRLGVFGRGRLGTAVAEQAGESLVWQHGRGTPPRESVDVVIDASSPAAVDQHLAWARASRTPLVIATTGWQQAALDAYRDSAIGVVTAPNGSLAVALFARLARMLGAYAATLPTAEGFLVEHHHASKRDTPSGTALRLADAWHAESGRSAGDAAPRLSISSIRAGHEVGYHVLGLDTPGEVLEIHHRARSRAAFAQGLLTAAKWVCGRHGLFTMDDVAAAVLDPIVRGASS